VTERRKKRDGRKPRAFLSFLLYFSLPRFFFFFFFLLAFPRLLFISLNRF